MHDVWCDSHCRSQENLSPIDLAFIAERNIADNSSYCVASKVAGPRMLPHSMPTYRKLVAVLISTSQGCLLCMCTEMSNSMQPLSHQCSMLGLIVTDMQRLG